MLCRLWDAVARWFIARALAADLEAWDLLGEAHIADCMTDETERPDDGRLSNGANGSRTRRGQF